MPAVQNIVVRMYALQYDGTNAQAVVDLVNDHFQQTMFTVQDEGGGVLHLHSHNSAYDDVTMSTDDYMIVPDALSCTPAQFAYRYNLLPN